jgi:hypothetical protein
MQGSILKFPIYASRVSCKPSRDSSVCATAQPGDTRFCKFKAFASGGGPDETLKIFNHGPCSYALPWASSALGNGR